MPGWPTIHSRRAVLGQWKLHITAAGLHDHRDRAPRTEVRDGAEYIIVEGTYPRKMPRGRSKLEGEELERSRAGGSDVVARARDRDKDGITAEIVYPTSAMFTFVSFDPPFQMAMARTYNDWAHDSFGGHPRFAPAAVLPVIDITAAIAEIQRVAQLGFRSLFMPVQLVNQRQYNDPIYDPLWAAVQESGLVVSFHRGTGYEPRGERGPGGAVINYVLHAQGDGPYLFTYLCATGVLQRFPGIHFVTVETDAAWLACTGLPEHLRFFRRDDAAGPKAKKERAAVAKGTQRLESTQSPLRAGTRSTARLPGSRRSPRKPERGTHRRGG